MAPRVVVALGDPVTDITYTTTRDAIVALLAPSTPMSGATHAAAAVPVEIGGCTQVTRDELARLALAIAREARITPGGSAANVLKGLAALDGDRSEGEDEGGARATGGRRVFVGGVDGSDDVGKAYRAALERAGVQARLIEHFDADQEIGSARCLCLVDEFGQRTMRTYLGASALTTAEDLPIDAFDGIDVLHMEGYVLYKPELVKRACALAKANPGALVSIDLASFEVVRHCRAALSEVLESGMIDVIFCNEDEARELVSNLHDEDGANGRNAPRPSEAMENAALDYLLRFVKVAACSRGKRGCVARSSNGDVGASAAEGVDAIDTTGAGDTFTSAFLHAYLRGGTLQQCGDAGCAAGAEIVQVRGAEMSSERWARVREKIRGILSTSS